MQRFKGIVHGSIERGLSLATKGLKNVRFDAWNEGWNNGWNVGYNAAAGGGAKPAAPTPVPTPAQYQSTPDPWNSGWNTGWNTGYNAYKPPASGTGGGTTPPSTGGTQAVLGASTAPTGSTSTTNPTSAQDALNAQIRTNIGSGFDSYINGLNTQLGLLPEHHQALVDNVNALFGGQQSTINTERTNQNAGLDKANTDVATNQASTLRDLSTNFQQSLDAANSKLGAVGASDSSASPMFAYALSLQANKNRGNVLQQANQLYSDINLKRTQVNSTLDDQMNQLNTWKNTQLSGLATWLTDQKSKFANAIGMAGQQKATALASLDQTALQRLQQLDDQFTQYKEGLSQWAIGQQTQLGNTLAYLGKLSAVNIPQFTAGSIDSGIHAASQATPQDLFGYNPFAGNGQKFDQFGNPING